MNRKGILGKAYLYSYSEYKLEDKRKGGGWCVDFI